MHLNPMIVSAPFGNYFSYPYPGATSTLGTFTWHYRGGPIKRLWRCLLTLRYVRKAGGWVNRLGLPNPGIDALRGHRIDQIISIHGFTSDEWESLAVRAAKGHSAMAVEFNLSCPNVGATHVAANVKTAIERIGPHRCIAKLPPVRWMALAEPLYDMGVRHFHCCNTIPTPHGGLSGKTLKQYSLWATEEISQKWYDAVVIGGGGVTCLQDVNDYLAAGAKHVAIGSMLLNPLNWKKARRLASCQFDFVKRRAYFDE